MIIRPLWFELVTFLFFWAAAVTFVIGLVTLISPPTVMRAGVLLNRWISTDPLFDRLNSPRTTERMFYRHHRVFGVLLIAGAGYILYSFGFGPEAGAIAAKWTLFGSRSAGAWLLQSLIALNLAFAVIALGLGVAIFVRPSILKNLESATNRWFRVDDSIKRLDQQLAAPDRLFWRRPRLLGVLIMAGSLYIMVSLRLFLPA